MITTSSCWAISGIRRCISREGSATIRNGNAACGGSPGYIAARSDHSRALPEGSASTSRTLWPACAKMCASQTADVVLPVPGLRFARARLRPVIQVLSSRRPLFGRRGEALRWAGRLLVPVAVVQYSRHHCTAAALRAGLRAPPAFPQDVNISLPLRRPQRRGGLPVSSVDEPAAEQRGRAGGAVDPPGPLVPPNGSRCWATQVCRRVREDPARRG